MQVVADHLVARSAELENEIEKNLFARSAFNRYYYAMFLMIRETLAEINPDWDRPFHKEVPELLRGAVIKKFQRQARNAPMQRGKAEKIKSRGCTAAKSLADMIESGNETRQVADYQPKILIQFDGSAVRLGNVKLSSARSWCVSGEQRCQVLLNAAKQLGLCQ